MGLVSVINKNFLVVLLYVIAGTCCFVFALHYIGVAKKVHATKCHPELVLFTKISNKVKPFVGRDKKVEYANIDDLFANEIISEDEYSYLKSNNAIYYPSGMSSRPGLFFLACRYDKKRTWIMALCDGIPVIGWNPLIDIEKKKRMEHVGSKKKVFERNRRMKKCLRE